VSRSVSIRYVSASCMYYFSPIVLTLVCEYFYRMTRCIAQTMPSQDVCLSVRPSVCHTPVLSLNDYTYPQKFFHCRVVPPFYFSHNKRDDNIPTGTPLTRASNARGYEKSRFSTSISLYLENDAR